MEPQTKAPQATQACPQPGDAAVTNKRTGQNGFRNFSEISYEKTRASYDQSEIALETRISSSHTNWASLSSKPRASPVSPPTLPPWPLVPR